LRREVPALAGLDKEGQQVLTCKEQKVISVRRGKGLSRVFIVFHFDGAPTELLLPVPQGRWKKLLDSAAPQWGGQTSHAPDILDSHGEVRLALDPWAFVAFTASDEIAR
jgi:maltooligosyltrehalose trehalohydrolase